MILNLIQSYIEQKAELVNANYDTGIQLRQIVTELDLGLIGVSESRINYQLFISSIESGESEGEDLSEVSVRLDFIINVANKKYTVYKKIFDRYLFAFQRVLKRAVRPLMAMTDEDISTGITIIDIKNVSITNGDRFEDGYYMPSIEFILTIMDSSDLLIYNTVKSESV